MVIYIYIYIYIYIAVKNIRKFSRSLRSFVGHSTARNLTIQKVFKKKPLSLPQKTFLDITKIHTAFREGMLEF